MMRALILIAVVCVFCRWAFGKWPWDFLRSAPTRSQAVFRARKLLGVEAGAGRDEIVAAHRRLTTLVHPDKGGTTAAMQEANAARDLLLDDLPLPGEGADV
ncbi:J domain-containing protein [Porphyrobacter sp. ULC335]|jgi:DnaJ homolog subfamily C member 19|uniref:J domain-containing protein n=1 Tax=Porphyrobacter sp. ULC335 TaxID=2854260 RepID=UPI00221FC4E1|nr:J domain-containing protein [Porphyrobacter sp. ULC335]UYV16004.1 J domain-containing protein [Porphyrobacter sp. ULC335]